LSLCLCVHHNVIDTFGCRHSPTSCQRKVNVGQNEVRLPKKLLCGDRK
jgi:hypothetical protein